MATLNQIKTAVDNLKDTVGPIIVRRQNAYFSARGRYWQGILTPTAPPDDLADAVMDYARRPTDQQESWADAFAGSDALPAALKAQMRVDVENGPSGHGWSVTLRFSKNGRTYERTWGFGSASDVPWTEVFSWS